MGEEQRRNRIIAVAGTMGSGKSTLVEFLTRRFGVTPFFEPNEANPYLADFYEDMPRWALASQVFFLTHKVAIHRAAEAVDGTAVLDRSVYEDAEVFAENLRRTGTLSERDFALYRTLYEQLHTTLRPPDLLVYMRCSVRTIRRRIRLRGRPEEQNVPLAYVRRLHQLYEDWFARYDLSPTLVIPSDKLDYLSDLVHRIDLLETIERYL